MKKEKGSADDLSPEGERGFANAKQRSGNFRKWDPPANIIPFLIITFFL
jgi:hypothetical protein